MFCGYYLMQISTVINNLRNKIKNDLLSFASFFSIILTSFHLVLPSPSPVFQCRSDSNNLKSRTMFLIFYHTAIFQYRPAKSTGTVSLFMHTWTHQHTFYPIWYILLTRTLFWQPQQVHTYACIATLRHACMHTHMHTLP